MQHSALSVNQSVICLTCGLWQTG